MSLHRFTALPLPGPGSFVVGKAPDVDIELRDGSVSARHARITLDPGGCFVQDLGSGAGTFLREVPLPPRQWVPFLPGEPIRVGTTVLMVRGRTARLQLRRLWSSSEFAGLVEDECLRAHRRASVFAVAHLGLDGQGPGTGGPPLGGLADLLGRVDGVLPPPHVLGAAAGQGLQALLVAVPSSWMKACLRRLVRVLHAGGYSARVGVAWYPRDAQTSGALRALAALRAGAISVPEARTPGPQLVGPSPECPGEVGLEFIRETPP